MCVFVLATWHRVWALGELTYIGSSELRACGGVCVMIEVRAGGGRVCDARCDVRESKCEGSASASFGDGGCGRRSRRLLASEVLVGPWRVSYIVLRQRLDRADDRDHAHVSLKTRRRHDPPRTRRRRRRCR